MQRLAICLAMSAVCVVFTSAGRAPAGPLSLYVSPGGDDGWSGRLAQPNSGGTDGPFASITRAQKAVRDLRAPGKLPGPVTVCIRGVHRLAEPIVFRPEDSGTAEAPVTYTACPGEKPVLSGGRVIAGWSKGPNGVWTAEVPDAKSGRWYFRQLFVNGRRACRARSPNQGFFRVDGLVDPKPGAEWNQGVDRFRFKPGDLRPWNDLNNVEAVVFHSWNTSRVRMASVDAAKGIVTFTGPTIFRPLGWDPNQRYYVENARELLDSSGEWYLDRSSGVVSYWPLPGEDMTRRRASANCCDWKATRTPASSSITFASSACAWSTPIGRWEKKATATRKPR